MTVFAIEQPAWCSILREGEHVLTGVCYLTKSECDDFANTPPGHSACEGERAAACFTFTSVMSGKAGLMCGYRMSDCHDIRDRLTSTHDYSGIQECAVARYRGR